MGNPAILLRRLNPCCAHALEGPASLCQSRACAEILPEHWLQAQRHGEDVEFVGRAAGAEAKERELSPALQKALDKFIPRRYRQGQRRQHRFGVQPLQGVHA